MRRVSATDVTTPGSAPRLERAIRSHWQITRQPLFKNQKKGGWRLWRSAQIHSSTSGQRSRHRRRLEFTSSPYPGVQMSGCHSNLLILLHMSDGEVGLEHRRSNSEEDLNADKCLKIKNRSVSTEKREHYPRKHYIS